MQEETSNIDFVQKIINYIFIQYDILNDIN